MEAVNLLNDGITCDVIDVQMTIPFDISQDIVESVKHTNRLLIIDEDVPEELVHILCNRFLKINKLISI